MPDHGHMVQIINECTGVQNPHRLMHAWMTDQQGTEWQSLR